MSLRVSSLAGALVLDRDDPNFYQPVNSGLSDTQKADVYNSFHDLVRDALKGNSLSGSCPMSVRHQIQAQHNYRAKENGVENGENIRIRNLWSCTIEFVLTLTARILRVVLRTLFIPVTPLYSLYQANKYDLKDWVVEDIKRLGHEWIDLGITLASFFTGVVNTFAPNAIPLDKIRDYYIERIADVETKNKEFDDAKREYDEKRKENRANYDRVNNQTHQRRLELLETRPLGYETPHPSDRRSDDDN